MQNTVVSCFPRKPTGKQSMPISPFVRWLYLRSFTLCKTDQPNPWEINTQYRQFTYKPMKTIKIQNKKTPQENCMTSRRLDDMNNKKKTLIVSFVSSQWLFGKWTAEMAGESTADITALASPWHNIDKWTVHMGWSRADAQLITTSLIAHSSGSVPGVRSKWSEASDFRQTLPNAAEGPARRCVGTQQWGYGCTCVASFSGSTKHTPMAIYQQRRRDTHRPGSKMRSRNLMLSLWTRLQLPVSR